MYLAPEDRSLESVICRVAESIRPPERLTVSEAAEKYRKLNNRGGYSGDWQNSMTPYLTLPQNLLTSQKYDGVVFVGPAQCGKTEMYLNWLLYTVVCDPADMMLVEATQSRASDFSKLRIDRLHRDTPAMKERLSTNRNRDNTFDKRYVNGVYVKLAWPTPTELSGKPMSRMFLTDYDRMDQNVGGDGTPMILAQARTTTFGRYGMTLAESSPSYPILDPRWAPKTPHEAPPAAGIVALYNEGDRRMWYWPCINCKLAFQPDFDLLHWDKFTGDDEYKGAETVRLKCPHCEHEYYHEPHGSTPGKMQMNQRGFWMKDGQTYNVDENGVGRIEGEGRKTRIASFWLKGTAATFQNWSRMVSNYQRALAEYGRTGNEETLKATINVDQGRSYLPKSMETERIPEHLKRRAKELGNKVVPRGVRFLVASVDVQKSRFVAQVHGVGEGGDMWIIDRFDLKFGRRIVEAPDESIKDQKDIVRPFTYVQDWREILSRVIRKEYPVADGSERLMKISMTVCDSGGMNQATSNAYEFWRWLKRGPSERDQEFKNDIESYEHWMKYWEPGIHKRFQLYKGASTDTAPRVWIDHPDTKKKGKFANARGEIPVLMVNTTLVKDKVDGMLDRNKKFHGRINFPKWLPLEFYQELCTEVKDPEKKGRWVNPGGHRNESWDLLVMAVSLLVSNRFQIEKVDWLNPPTWALDWDDNDNVYDPNAVTVENKRQSKYSIAELAKELS